MTTDSPVKQEDDFAPGAIVASRYRVVRKLGEGGMGAVHLVEHVHMRKPFALKVLHPEAMRSPELVARFEREAVASANIEHPNVAKATDFGKLPDGSYFLVLEYVEGQSLREVIALGALVPMRALAIARKVLAGLEVAHRLGFVHRDIKPENILLTGKGDDVEPKILDFGLTRVVEVGGEQLTRAGIVCGTPSYMSPEQAVAQTVDLRADLYAVGVLLFEMISGDKPFKGDTLEILGKHVAAPPPPLTSPHGEVTAQMHALVEALLAKSPDQRPANATAAIALVDAARASIAGVAREKTQLAPQRPVVIVPASAKAETTRPMGERIEVVARRAKAIGRRAKELFDDAVVAVADRAKLPRARVRKIAAGVGIGAGLLVVLLLTCAVLRKPSQSPSSSTSSSSSVTAAPTVAAQPPTTPPLLVPIKSAPASSSGWKIKSAFH